MCAAMEMEGITRWYSATVYREELPLPISDGAARALRDKACLCLHIYQYLRHGDNRLFHFAHYREVSRTLEAIGKCVDRGVPRDGDELPKGTPGEDSA
jgi:hypothetical protein